VVLPAGAATAGDIIIITDPPPIIRDFNFPKNSGPPVVVIEGIPPVGGKKFNDVS